MLAAVSSARTFGSSEGIDACDPGVFYHVRGDKEVIGPSEAGASIVEDVWPAFVRESSVVEVVESKAESLSWLLLEEPLAQALFCLVDYFLF